MEDVFYVICCRNLKGESRLKQGHGLTSKESKTTPNEMFGQPDLKGAHKAYLIKLHL